MKTVWILHHASGIENYENTRLLECLDSNGFKAKILEPKYFDIIVSRTTSTSIRYKGEKINLPDLILSRTGSGSAYFTLALMRQFERLGVQVINDSASVGTVADKLETSQVLAQAGLPIPKTILVNDAVDTDLVEKEIGFPCVVKATKGSRGKTVTLCQTRESFESLIDLLSNLANIKKTLIIQEFIDAKPGTDLRVWIIGGKTVVAMKRTGAEGDFRANLSQGGTAELFEVNDEIDYLSRETARVLGLQIAGIDLLFDREGYRICEANSSPGFKGIDRECGQDMAQKIVDFIKFKLQ